jgi:hypothetical protein
MDASTSSYSEHKAFSITFATLDLLPLPLFIICIHSVGPPAIISKLWRRLLPYLILLSLPQILLILAGAILYGLSLSSPARLCWIIATSLTAFITTLSTISYIVGPLLLRRSFPTLFASREVERQIFVALPLAVRTGWSVAAVFRSEIFVPQWRPTGSSSLVFPPPSNGTQQQEPRTTTSSSSLLIRHCLLALLPELLALVVFLAATWRTRRSIRHATRRSLRRSESGGKRWSTMTVPAANFSSDARHSTSATKEGQAQRQQRTLSEFERDILASIAASLNANGKSNTSSLPWRKRSWKIEPTAAKQQQQPQPFFTISPSPYTTTASSSRSSSAGPPKPPNESLAAQRNLALVLVVTCISGLEHPISALEAIAIRRRLDFFLTASESTFADELERSGWSGVQDLYAHRRQMVELIKEAVRVCGRAGPALGMAEMGMTGVPVSAAAAAGTSTPTRRSRPGMGNYGRRSGVPMTVTFDLFDAGGEEDGPPGAGSEQQSGRTSVAKVHRISMAPRMSGMYVRNSREIGLAR